MTARKFLKAKKLKSSTGKKIKYFLNDEYFFVE